MHALDVDSISRRPARSRRTWSAEVLNAYRRWGSAMAPDAWAAFGDYGVALDREEHAARLEG